ncbi:MAG: hypothetical protein QXM16_05475 [Nitrososphaerota archaeon]
MRGLIGVGGGECCGMAHYARIFGRATALALTLALPPILGLLYLRNMRLYGALEITLWILFSLLWNTLILVLVVRGKLFSK